MKTEEILNKLKEILLTNKPPSLDLLKQLSSELTDSIESEEEKDRISFMLSESETKRYREFTKNHRHPDVYKGTIGGGISLNITPTGLGDAYVCRCNVCGSTEDITDYHLW